MFEVLRFTAVATHAISESLVGDWSASYGDIGLVTLSTPEDCPAFRLRTAPSTCALSLDGHFSSAFGLTSFGRRLGSG
ncbi:hypothetical protein DPMN_014821 [Dreissena polymorpha]|uniref:Uncharacterized protein n=1 Tax=Dreissena polymorpha TaxID=45954 RepID=A0A9D4N6Q4_DREPO|nr:hypothetical protein DPMN_014821 [Dreissena polymorpha]